MIVIINRGAGHHNDNTVARVTQLFRSHGVAVQFAVAEHGGEIPALAEEAARSQAEVVVAAGGDGTIDGVAAGLDGTGKILGVVPLGTFNLFAKRLGIPLDLEAAIHTIVHGAVTSVHVGEVNGQMFLSRSSLGLYPLALRQREKMYQRFGRSRLIALLSGATGLLRWGNVMTIRLTTDSGERVFRSRFVFVCNNPEELDYFHLGGRDCIEAGKLAVYVPKPISPVGLMRLGIRMFKRQLRETEDFESVCAREILLEITPSPVPVCLDGEVEMIEGSLHYKIRPGDLRVRVPAGAPRLNGNAKHESASFL